MLTHLYGTFQHHLCLAKAWEVDRVSIIILVLEIGKLRWKEVEWQSRESNPAL